MATTPDSFHPFAQRMRAARLPQIAIDNFRFYYEQLLSGQTGLIPETAIEPVAGLPDIEALAGDARLLQAGRAALPHTVAIKLNGGLGTSMGLSKAKTLLRIKGADTFLDIIARQALYHDYPLVLMNSFNTRADSLAALAHYPALQRDIPLDFVQHKVPKVRRSDHAPVSWPADRDLEWNPPGHGDLYIALATSGMLDALLSAGYRYAFVSNADNLGAVMDAALLGYFVAGELPFMMEVADRTHSDRKGGHLARRPDGQLVLRESAQCPVEDLVPFQDVDQYKYFNTNNIWLNLPFLQKLLEERSYVLGLPMICNAKTLDPRDKHSEPVYQVETAMGSAIAVFAGAAAIRVPRSRFAAVKTTSDLLLVRSDAYVLTEDDRMVLAPGLPHPPLITLDPAHYKLIDQLEARFPFGPPSLLAVEQLEVRGDVRFGAGVTLSGSVQLAAGPAPLQIADGAAIGSASRDAPAQK